MLSTLCVSTTNVHKAKTTHAHKDKPSKFPEQVHKHDIAINMPKDDRWSIKKKGVKTQQELMEWVWVFETIGEKTKEDFEFWMQAKISEGIAIATTIGDTLVEY